MDKRYKEIQARYIAEMKGIMPVVREWWERNTDDDENDPVDVESFDARWPAGPVAHPYILAVFRKYFLEADELNLETESERRHDDAPPSEDDWGQDNDGAIAFTRPIDLLVNDLEFIEPDLFEVLQDLVFVPVGAVPGGEFC